MVEEYNTKKTTMPQYGDCEYWDERYSREPAAFDWYQGYNGLQTILHQAFPLHATLLQVGVGSSRLQEDMARAGWRHIVNVDYSRVVIKHMAELHQGLPSLEYRVADVRHMPEFADCSFEGVLDKGTLDAILCGERSSQNASSMLAECYRVLKPGYPFVLITYGDPSSRLSYLEEIPGWDVLVYALTKQEMLEAMDAEPVVRPLVKGPYPASNVDCMDALSGLEGMHFVYMCHKRLAHDEEEVAGDPATQPQAEGVEGQALQERQPQAPQEQPLPQQPPQQQLLHPHPRSEDPAGPHKPGSAPTAAAHVSAHVHQPQPSSGVSELPTDEADTGVSLVPERPAAAS